MLDASVTLAVDAGRGGRANGKEVMARRRYQTGCLFIRGRKGRKVWVARWREDVMKPDGSLGRVMRSTVLGSVNELPKCEARKKLEDRLRPINQGLHRPLSMLLFREYAKGDWSSLLLPTFKLSTQRGYRMVLGRHLLPCFGDQRLCDIAKLGIQQFVAEKFRQGLAWQTVRNAWIVLSSILDSAVEYGYLAVNPARGVKFPSQPPRQDPEIFTAEALARLLVHLQEPFKTMVTLAALTGLRIGEILALRWRAIDVISGTVRVSESVFQGHFQKPKSEKSIRTIPIGPALRGLLENHRQRSVHSRPDDLVFPSRRNGAHRESNLLERVVKPAGKAAGIGRVTWHQFRHIHSSLLHDLGVPAKVVQQQLGHATVQTTLNVYTHVVQNTHRKAIEDLERVLFPTVPKLARVEESGEFVIQ